MKIKELETKVIPIRLNAPFKTALREVRAVNVVRVMIYFDNGLVGIGEATPSQALTGDTQESITKAIEEVFRPFLLEKEIDEKIGRASCRERVKRWVEGEWRRRR